MRDCLDILFRFDRSLNKMRLGAEELSHDRARSGLFGSHESQVSKASRRRVVQARRARAVLGRRLRTAVRLCAIGAKRVSEGSGHAPVPFSLAVLKKRGGSCENPSP